MRFPGKSAPAATASAGSSKEGNGSTFSFGVLTAMLVCAAAFLGIGAPAASAAPEARPGYGYLTSFGSGDFSFGYSLRNTVGIDSHDNIVVSNVNSSQVRIYAPDPAAGGTFLTSFGSAIFPIEIAVDSGSDAIYLNDRVGAGKIVRFVSDGQPSPTYTEDPGFEAPSGENIAVDPVSHDLLVADGSAEAIRRYNTSGSLVETIATPAVEPQRLAVAPDGSIYTGAESSPDIAHLSSTGTLLGKLEGVGSGSSLAVDPSNERVVALVGNSLKLYSAAGSLLSESASIGGEGGLAIGASGRLYAFAEQSVHVYEPATIPGVEAPVVTGITATSAHLSVEVDPGSGPPAGSTLRFEYSEDGGEHWSALPDQAVGGAEKVETELTGLSLNTEILVRAQAFNSLASSTSATTAFSTPDIAPLVQTGTASDRSETGAVLHGTVNPAGLLTTYHFEYGTTTAYGNEAPLGVESSAGNHRIPRSVSVAIGGLQPGTTYHYRLVASNAIGETAGEDMTFTTITAAEAFPQRAYEQVTPVDKRGAQIASEFHTQIDPGGSWIAVAGASGSREDEGVFMRTNYVVHRGAEDWEDWVPTEAPQSAASLLLESGTTGISADGNHALVVSNRVLAPGGAYAGGGNLYDKDLRTGSYTFVGGAPGEGAYGGMANGIANESLFVAAAPDFDWILFWSGPSLLPEATGSGMYRWTRDEGLSIESWIPDPSNPGTEIVSPTIQFGGQGMLTLPSSTPDGDVVAFGTGSGVYRREGGVTEAISVSHIPGDPTTAQPGVFDGMSADGRFVFFHTFARLVEDMPADLGGEEAMYRYDATTGDLIFLMGTQPNENASLGISTDGRTAYAQGNTEVRVWRNGLVHTVAPGVLTSSGKKRVYVTETGRYLAFMMDGEAHLYDADADQEVCVSCPVDGSPGKGAFISLPVRYMGNTMPRVVTEDGEMFFDTAAPLVSADRNGKRDVYAYRDGRLDLISPGDQNFDATYVGASGDGRDVYFQTDQGLVSRDVDENTDVYDARVGGGFASQNPPPPPAPCVRAGCAETSTGPVASPPVSSQKVVATKSHRPKKCKKGYVKKTVKGKRRCVKKPKAKKKAPSRPTARSRTFGK